MLFFISSVKLIAEIALLALFGQLPLALALSSAGFLGIAGVCVAAGAAHARFKEWRLGSTGLQRVTAGTAQPVIPRLEAMAHGDALIKDKAFALPQALFGGDSLQVLENAAFEVVDLVEAAHLHERGRFLAADAAGAEHRHLGLFGALQCGLCVQPGGQLGEGLDVRIDRALEGADGHLVVVAGVDDDRVGIGDQGVPVRGRDVDARLIGRVQIRLSHGDDLAFDAHLHPVERHRGGVREFDVDRSAPGQRADLLLVTGDPTADIRATRAIERIWKNGAAVERRRYPEAP